MGFVAPVLALAGGVISFMGQRSAANAAEAAGDAAYQNSLIEAENQRRETRENLGRGRTNNNERLAMLRARLGAPLSGSSLDVFSKAAGRMELELQDTLRSSEIAANRTVQQGRMAQWSAQQQAQAMRIQGYGSLLSSASSAASSAYNPAPKLTSLY